MTAAQKVVGFTSLAIVPVHAEHFLTADAGCALCWISGLLVVVMVSMMVSDYQNKRSIRG